MQLSQLPQPQPILRCLSLNSNSTAMFNPNVQPLLLPQDGELTDKNCSVSVVGKDTTFTLLEDEALAPYITGGCWAAGRRRAAVLSCRHTSWRLALPAATPSCPRALGCALTLPPCSAAPFAAAVKEEEPAAAGMEAEQPAAEAEGGAAAGGEGEQQGGGGGDEGGAAPMQE